MDWEKYHLRYPDHYLKWSRFDDIIEIYLIKRQGYNTSCLDIGGGIHGTKAIKDNVRSIAGIADCYLLDPYIKNTPLWMKGSTVWGTTKKFDFIVARGSFNYLTPKQIKKIPKMLDSGGIFMANTFLKAKSGARIYTNSESGTTGYEKFYPEGKKMIHVLQPNKSIKPIKHTFNIYTPNDIFDMLGKYNVTLKQYDKNSLLIKIGD